MKNPYVSVVLKELPIEQGLTKTDVIDMVDMLEDNEFLPIETENPNGGSIAVGFITVTAFESINYSIKAIEDVIKPVLADMNLETDDNRYIVPETDITIFMSR